MPQHMALPGLRAASQQPFTAAEQELRDALNKPSRPGWSWDWNSRPEVEPAPPFRPAPQMFTTDPQALQAMHRLLGIAPELQGRIKSVRMGPDANVIRDLWKSGLSAYDYPRSTLLGTTRLGHITLNPGLSGSEDIEDVLTHEAMHAAGGNERRAEEVEQLPRKIRKGY